MSSLPSSSGPLPGFGSLRFLWCILAVSSTVLFTVGQRSWMLFLESAGAVLPFSGSLPRMFQYSRDNCHLHLPHPSYFLSLLCSFFLILLGFFFYPCTVHFYSIVFGIVGMPKMKLLPDDSASSLDLMGSITPWSTSFHLSVRTSINFLDNLSFGIRPHGPDLSPHCISEPWLPTTLSLVYLCSFLGPLVIDIDHCTPGTPHKSCRFGDALTHLSSQHSLALVTLLTFAHFS